MSTKQLLGFLFFSVLFSFSSCVKYKQLIEFRKEEAYTSFENHPITNQHRIYIQPDDILFIQVYALDPRSVQPFNKMPEGATNNIGGESLSFSGYLVDPEGYVDFPVLGKAKLGGLTSDEAKSLLIDSLDRYIVDPVVTVRFVNFKVTILGEINNPGPVSIQGERITIIELVGQAGGFTPYSNKDRVTIIREKDGERIFGEIDMRSPDLFNSPYFYLQQNDVVYVEPVKEVTATVRDPISESLPIISGIISIVAIALALR